MASSRELLRTIATATIDDVALQDAIGTLSSMPADEGISFWTDICGSELYSDVHRTRCYCALFRRHVKTGMKVSALLDCDRVIEWINLEEIGLMRGDSLWPDRDRTTFLSRPDFLVFKIDERTRETRAVVYFNTQEQPTDEDRHAVSSGQSGYPLTFLETATFLDVSLRADAF